MVQIINQIGHLQHWGISPATNLLQKNNQKKQESIRILLTGLSDIRNIMKTVSDVCTQNKFHTIHFYLHQTQKQLLCRMLLQLHILHQQHLNFEERTQLFLDLYGNAMIKQRNSRYLHQLREDFLNFIHDQKKINTPLKKFVKLKLLKFQQRDEMSQIIQSWSNKIPFDMVKLRDTRLRYQFGQRYDYKSNMVDWDFNMLLTQCAGLVHFYHYKQWRLTGLAYQQRFSTYTQPNRTLSSYAPGRKKQQKTSCLVRGYWGDLVCSPYIAMGVATNYPQKQLLFKKANYKNIGHSVELTQYHMNYWLYKLQKLETYVKIFRDYYRTDDKQKQQLDKKDKQRKKKKKKDNNTNELQNIQQKTQQEDIKQQQEKQQQKQESQQKQQEIQQKKQSQVQQPQKPSKKKRSNEEQLDSDQQRRKQEVQRLNAKDIQIIVEDKPILKGFQKVNIEIHLLGMPIQSLTKPKFHNFFDIVNLGFSHSAYITKGLTDLLKQGGRLWSEKATYLIPKKKQQRLQINKNLSKLIIEQKLNIQQETSDYFIAIK